MAAGIGSGTLSSDPLLATLQFGVVRKQMHTEIKSFLKEATSITHISKGSPLEQKLFACLDAHARYVAQKAIVKPLLAEKIAVAKDSDKAGKLNAPQEHFKQQTRKTKALFLQFVQTYLSLTKNQHLLHEPPSKTPTTMNPQALDSSAGTSTPTSSSSATASELPKWPELTHSSDKLRCRLNIDWQDTEIWHPNTLREHLLTFKTSLEKIIHIRKTTTTHDEITTETKTLYLFLDSIKDQIHQRRLISILRPLSNSKPFSPNRFKATRFQADLNQAFRSQTIEKLEECLARINSESVWGVYPVQARSNLSAKGIDLIHAICTYNKQTLAKTPIPQAIKDEVRNTLINLICTSPKHIRSEIFQSLKEQNPRRMITPSQEWLEANLDQELSHLKIALESIAVIDPNEYAYRFY